MSTGFIVASIILLVAGIAGFIWLNRNKPEALDKAEDFIRGFKK